MAPMGNDNTWYFVDSTANNYTYTVRTPLVPTWVDKDGTPAREPSTKKPPLAWLDSRIRDVTRPIEERMARGY